MKELRERTRVVISSQDMEQKITTLRERAILLFQESPQKNRSELINIGLELIHIDPLLHEYKASLDTDQDQMIRLIRTGAFMNLIEEDITGLIIAPNDRTIAVPGGKISGFSLIKLYLVRLQDKLSNLGQNSIDVLKVPYLNGSGVKSELCLLASKNASDDFDYKLLQILKEPPIPEYMVTCIEECLKPQSCPMQDESQMIV